MVTNRTRTRHPRKVEISETLLACFMRQQTLQQKYHQCCLRKACVWIATTGKHCDDCSGERAALNAIILACT